jgi:hypothetical protein
VTTDESADARDRVPERKVGRFDDASLARARPQQRRDRSVDDDAYEGSVTALGPVHGAAGSGGSPAAEELLRAMGRLMDALSAERARAMAAEERSRNAEIDNARLRAELAGERDARRRLDRELESLRKESEERRTRADAEIDRLTLNMHSRGRTVGGRVDGGGREDSPGHGVRVADARAAAETVSRLATGDHRVPHAAGGAGLDAGTGEPPATEDSSPAVGRPTPPPPPQEIPELPAGWRYASELPPVRPRRWWRRRAH